MTDDFESMRNFDALIASIEELYRHDSVLKKFPPWFRMTSDREVLPDSPPGVSRVRNDFGLDTPIFPSVLHKFFMRILER